MRAEYEAKRHGFAVIVEKVPPIPMRWRLLLGDIANDYKAALDHLAWALVSRGRTPPGTGKLTPIQEGAIYFLICGNKAVFNAETSDPKTPKSRLKMPGLRRADRAKVRRYQPYHYTRNRPRHVLVLLSKVNNDDKHNGAPMITTHTEEDTMIYAITGRTARYDGECVVCGQTTNGKREMVALLKAGTKSAVAHAECCGGRFSRQGNYRGPAQIEV